MYKGLAKIAEGAQRMYSSTATPIVAALTAGAIAGCAVAIKNDYQDMHQVSQWKGLPTVQKQDAGLAKRLAGMNDVWVASRELNSYCPTNDAYQKMCDQLVKDGHAEEVVDMDRVMGVAATVIILKGITSGNGGSAGAVAKKGGGS